MGKRSWAVLVTIALVSAASVVTGTPASAATYTPSNGNATTIPDNGSALSRVKVNGAGGLITDVDVHLEDLNHTNPDDLDIGLFGPGGRFIYLMSDTCGSDDLVDVDLDFDDQAAASLPDDTACTSGSYRPTNVDSAEPPSLPVSGTTLSVFNGLNPNAISWSLVLIDDTNGKVGTLNGGWSLTIQTGPFSMAFPGNGTDVGPGSPYPLTIPVSGRAGTITDLDVTLPGVTDTFTDDIDMLLVGPNGAGVMLMSDVCVEANTVDRTYVVDDQADASFPGDTTCASGRYRPTNRVQSSEPIDPMAAPAPAGPYGTSLSAFDGISPNGDWKLYVMDDMAPSGSGFLVGTPTLDFTLTDVTDPNTVLVGRKPRSSTRKWARVRFGSTEAGSTFECRLDGGRYRPCRSPHKVTHLRPGRHKLFVRAVDASGNVDRTALKYKWRVERP